MMLRWLWLSAAVVALDQLTKWLADHLLTLYAAKPVLPFFNLTLLYNQGAAFSFLAGASGWQRWFFIGIALVISVVLIVWLRRLPRHEVWEAGALALILGGAVGNVIDRIWHGHVIDFIDLHVAGYHWPAFNIADSAITVGAVTLVIHSLFFHQRQADKG
jgi:signal peptidase II